MASLVFLTNTHTHISTWDKYRVHYNLRNVNLACMYGSQDFSRQYFINTWFCLHGSKEVNQKYTHEISLVHKGFFMVSVSCVLFFYRGLFCKVIPSL